MHDKLTLNGGFDTFQKLRLNAFFRNALQQRSVVPFSVPYLPPPLFMGQNAVAAKLRRLCSLTLSCFGLSKLASSDFGRANDPQSAMLLVPNPNAHNVWIKSVSVPLGPRPKGLPQRELIFARECQATTSDFVPT